MKSENPLAGRKLYIQQMTYASTHLLAAAFRAIGVDASVTPDSDERTLELGGKFTSGEECLPEKITLGDYLKVVFSEGFDPKQSAFLMPTADGPCRFGQYRGLLRKILDELGYQDALIFSPTSANGYDGFGENGNIFLRSAWRAVIIGDTLTKALLKTRPYELRKGDTDEVFTRSIKRMSDVLSQQFAGAGEQLDRLTRALGVCYEEFRSVPADFREPKPLVGVVGEIFCRLNEFSNDSVVRKLEEYGCEAWISDIAEWIWYTNDEAKTNMNADGLMPVHPKRVKHWLKTTVQRRDEHQLVGTFADYFAGLEEPGDVREVLDASRPYLPKEGSLGEMVLSSGKAIYLYRMGADGIVDISPFTCMNGIITEAIYTKLSKDCDGIPIRTFYFDGISSDLDRDVGIFVELVKTYRRRKKIARVWPHRKETTAVA
jgi:predicted nucleotide-binding protein (sugar kinase/HSP70/actin superfamily)